MKRLILLLPLLAAVLLWLWTPGPTPAQLAIGTVRVQDGSHTQLARVTHANALTVDCVAGCASGGTVSHISSVTHIAAAGPLPVVQSPQGGVWNMRAHQGGEWTLAHVTSITHVAISGVTVSGGLLGVNCTGCSAASVVSVSHITSVTHVAAAGGALPVVQSGLQGAWGVTAHQGGQWNVAHITSVTHIIGSVMLRNQAGTLVTVTGTALDVNCTGCSSASVVSVAHVTSVTHVAVANGAMPVVQSGLQAAWGVTAHQGGSWNVAHVSSVTHVAMAAGVVVHVSATASHLVVRQATHVSAALACHSSAGFAQSASSIVIHAANSSRIGICGILLVSAGAQSISFVEGTGAACASNTKPLIGSTDATNGLSLAANGGWSQVSAFPFVFTTVSGNNICLLVSGSSRVSGTVTWAGLPDLP